MAISKLCQCGHSKEMHHFFASNKGVCLYLSCNCLEFKPCEVVDEKTPDQQVLEGIAFLGNYLKLSPPAELLMEIHKYPFCGFASWEELNKAYGGDEDTDYELGCQRVASLAFAAGEKAKEPVIEKLQETLQNAIDRVTELEAQQEKDQKEIDSGELISDEEIAEGERNHSCQDCKELGEACHYCSPCHYCSQRIAAKLQARHTAQQKEREIREIFAEIKKLEPNVIRRFPILESVFTIDDDNAPDDNVVMILLRDFKNLKAKYLSNKP